MFQGGEAGNFNRLVALQDSISEEKHAAYIGKTHALSGGRGERRQPVPPLRRTPGNRLVRSPGIPM